MTGPGEDPGEERGRRRGGARRGAREGARVGARRGRAGAREKPGEEPREYQVAELGVIKGVVKGMTLRGSRAQQGKTAVFSVPSAEIDACELNQKQRLRTFFRHAVPRAKPPWIHSTDCSLFQSFDSGQ